MAEVGRTAYWAAYRELVKKGWTSWWKVWAGTQGSFIAAFALHYFWLKREVDALANLEVHVIYVALPSLFGLLRLFVFSLIVAPYRMAKTIQEERDRRIEALEARVDELEGQLDPKPSKEMELLREVANRCNELLQDWVPEDMRSLGMDVVSEEDANEFWQWAYPRLVEALGKVRLDSQLRTIGLWQKWDAYQDPKLPDTLHDLQEWLVRLIELNEDDQKRDDPAETRLAVARKLLRDASLELRREVVEPSAAGKTARAYMHYAHRLMCAVLGQDAPHAKHFLIEDFSNRDHELNDHGGKRCLRYAESLSRYADLLGLPTDKATGGLVLHPGFRPKPDMTWRDY